MTADNQQLEQQIQQLQKFIDSRPEPREVKRALAAKLALSGYAYRSIVQILGVSFGFVSKWKNQFLCQGLPGLKLAHKGAKSSLSQAEKQEVINWIISQNYWDVTQLAIHLTETYGVEFQSPQSYYSLLNLARISWQKAQKINPKQDPDLVKKKNQEIAAILEKVRPEIEAESLSVYILDECHLTWGDICGYVWAPTKARVEIPISNERERQTYYGALNYATKEFIVQKYPTGNGENTVKFVKELRARNPGRRLLLIWDGASYHRSEDMQKLLREVNQGLTPETWQITCVLFAPYAPEENPVEGIWLQAKNFLRRFYPLCKTFKIVKRLFEFFLDGQFFNFPNFNKYQAFSQIN